MAAWAPAVLGSPTAVGAADRASAFGRGKALTGTTRAPATFGAGPRACSRAGRGAVAIALGSEARAAIGAAAGAPAACNECGVLAATDCASICCAYTRITYEKKAFAGGAVGVPTRLPARRRPGSRREMGRDSQGPIHTKSAARTGRCGNWMSDSGFWSISSSLRHRSNRFGRPRA